jgi:hypothetical protein
LRRDARRGGIECSRAALKLADRSHVHHLDWLENSRTRRRARQALLWSVGLTVALYLIPFGELLGYPLMLLSTLFHELGHGIAALAVGDSFESLAIYGDGSGVARHTGDSGSVGHAIVAAGGLVGPAIVAAVGFVVGRSAKGARVWLGVLGLALGLVVALFVRNPFGVVFTSAIALGLVALAWRTQAATAQLALVFLSTQLALSVFSRGDYLFTEVAQTGAGTMPSDTAQMATALGGPYWLWGLVCGAFSITVLAAGVLWFLRVLRDEPRRPVARTRTTD